MSSFGATIGHALSWVHDLSPFFIETKPGVGIRWYGLAYFLGVVLSWLFLRRTISKGYCEDLGSKRIADLTLVTGLAILAGGRFGYCLLYEQSLIFSFAEEFPYWEVLMSHKGGMSSHGGMIGLFLAVLLFSLKARSPLCLFDSVSAVAPIGIFLGRIGNFFNGELYGRPSEVSWAMHFPKSIVEETQSSLGEKWINVQKLLPIFENRSYEEVLPLVNRHHVNHDLIYSVMVPLRHPYQLYAAAIEGLAVFAIGMFVHGRHKRPGLTLGVVLVSYGGARIFCEFFRQWDIGRPLIGGYSLGQIYSIPLILCGLGFIFFSRQRGL